MKRRILTAAVFGCALSPSAHASDSKYFNGAFCRVSVPLGTLPKQSLAEYRGNGSIANRSLGESIEFSCPIVRDNVAGVNGWDSLEIGYFDKTAIDAINCNAYSGSLVDGSLLFNQMGLSANTAGTSWSKAGMTWGSNGGGFVEGFYWIRCVVPKAVDQVNLSGIAYYRIQES